jgi:NAD(P)-dependent dehydrogenase (short-subunit alcohol dehydrogenase family)
MLPRRRIGNPEDLDGLLLLLASDAAQLVNGAIIPVDGGSIAGRL